MSTSITMKSTAMVMAWTLRRDVGDVDGAPGSGSPRSLRARLARSGSPVEEWMESGAAAGSDPESDAGAAAESDPESVSASGAESASGAGSVLSVVDGRGESTR